MSDSVQMPALGESVTEGTVTRWLKNEGDRVEVDEPLLEVSTDKVDTEVPSPFAGVLEKILVQEDETVEVGAELAVIGSGEGGGDAAPAQDEQPAEEPAEDEGQSDESPAEKEEPASEESSEPSEQEVATEAKQQAGSGSSGSGEGQKVQMPALGESVTEGTVTRWLKNEGEQVEVDEPLLEVSTDKVDTEVPSPYAGVLSTILVQEDETVDVGTDLAVIGGESGGSESASASASATEETPQDAEEQAKEAEQPSEQRADQHQGAATGTVPSEEAAPRSNESEQPKAEQQQTPPQEASTTPAPERPSAADTAKTSYVTPIVRKLAKEKGVELESLQGTGVGGRIRKEDVLAAAEKAQQQAAPAPSEAPAAKAPSVPEVSPLRGTTEKMSRLRKVIAKRMVESLDTSAQLTTVIEVDVTRIAKLRARAKNSFQEREGVKLTYLPFFVKAATEALKAHPGLNASIEGDQIVYHGEENIGIAVDTERGLLVPVIKEAGDLTIAGIAKRVADLAARTRDNKVKPDELGGSTFTITNLGSNGALFDTPIINQPEVAILGLGAIVKRPVVVADADGNETIGIRSMVYLPLTYDHRLVDGADAGRFLQTVKKRLEEGAFEAELGL
ncbi:2-oxoglutarate dehydrogenase E2 component [Georgenia satyanarayanai]|uniref:Dihydrolipoamide acetyltransferase component of pyruvate dehydrogenase complex n=1 Tax=Georgenia satyanarayanai TaxID=860221 RepID=A0A2Y9BV54_9MICO|nr:2-oxoglutarate dehydrogenase, E2 component, dihydrolipoamide succinyltransferase [Georgenia satyanarayanai]PYG01979.1 2-oxoglutarate dehydrogenase E2 component [Georgenia satyanarayanai]SSA36782.1 2-oxoglutarate dehydrogenase E2 component [Georgenia satyanarayanai]